MADRVQLFRTFHFRSLLYPGSSRISLYWPSKGSTLQGSACRKAKMVSSYKKDHFSRCLCSIAINNAPSVRIPLELRGKFHQIRKLSKRGELYVAVALLDSLLETYATTATKIYFDKPSNCIVHYALESNDKELAKHQLLKMKKYGIKRNLTSFYLLALYYSQVGKLDEGINALKEMQAEGLQTAPRNYCPLISLAANQGKLETMFALYNELKANHKLFHGCDGVVIEGIMKCQERHAWRNRVHEILHSLKKDRVKLSRETADIVKRWFESESEIKWIVNSATVNLSGVCQSCGNTLQSGSLTKTERQVLKQNIIDYLWKNIHGSFKISYTENGRFTDMLLYPEDRSQLLISLEEYITATGPYDIVMDLANVGFFGNKGKFSQDVLNKTVQYFLDKGKKVLVVGNPRMPKISFTNLISQNCGMFLVNSNFRRCKSHKPRHQGILEDIFILLAAIHCGPNTLILSNDMYEDHHNKLPLDTQPLFGRWLRTNQICLEKHPDDKNVCYKRQPCFDPVVQQAANMWHLPLDDGISWLCINT